MILRSFPLDGSYLPSGSNPNRQSVTGPATDRIFSRITWALGSPP